MKSLKIKKIVVEENADVYDIEVQDNHNMIANGIVVHNCVEIGMMPVLYDEAGNKTDSGWSCCNLSEIIGSACKTEEDFYNACRAAAVIGTMQAAYTDFPYLNKASETIMRRDALLGVSITGMMDNPEIIFNEEIQRKGAEIVKETNIAVAQLIGINPAKRTTCVKPSGCLNKETKIKTNRGLLSLEEIFELNGYKLNELTHIEKEFLKTNTNIKIYNENNELENITALYINGISDVYEIIFEDGTIIKATENHKFKTNNGWKKASELSENDDIISFICEN